MLADTLERFVREKYGFEARQRIAQSPQGCSRDMWRRFAELGALAVLFEEAHGGMGGTGFDIMVVFEAIGRGLVVEPLAGALMAGQVLAATDSRAARHEPSNDAAHASSCSPTRKMTGRRFNARRGACRARC